MRIDLFHFFSFVLLLLKCFIDIGWGVFCSFFFFFLDSFLNYLNKYHMINEKIIFRVERKVEGLEEGVNYIYYPTYIEMEI